MSYPDEGVIKHRDSVLHGTTFKIAEIVRHRKGINGWLQDLNPNSRLRLSATDEVERGPDGVERLVFKRAVRERKHSRA